MRELADVLDPQLDGVAGLEEPAPAHADARRRAGEHQIPRMKGDARGKHRDLLGRVEDQLRGMRLLHQLAVHPQLDPERVRITDVARGHDPRAERARALEALLADPVVVKRRGGRILVALHRVSRRQVVGDGPAGDAGERLSDRDVLGGPADDRGQLDLPVDLLRVRGQFYLRAGPDHRAPRSLHEVPGFLAEVKLPAYSQKVDWEVELTAVIG